MQWHICKINLITHHSDINGQRKLFSNCKFHKIIPSSPKSHNLIVFVRIFHNFPEAFFPFLHYPSFLWSVIKLIIFLTMCNFLLAAVLAAFYHFEIEQQKNPLNNKLKASRKTTFETIVNASNFMWVMLTWLALYLSGFMAEKLP